jgi:hypothetical protein
MEKNKKTIHNEEDDYEREAPVDDGEDEINYDELTSHKIDKNVQEQKRRKRLIVVLEHA